MTGRLVSYVQLTKPTIMLLILVSGGAALVLEGSFINQPGRFVLFLIGLFMTGGAANALNQYFERNIDAQMNRTRNRRPLPSGRLKPSHALVFAILSAFSGVILLGVAFNLLTAALSLLMILFYGLIYTLWLKPLTPQNIVIGGAAGAMVPIGAWTAATGTVALPAIILFVIILLWTPPHFWSLAICHLDDYRKVKLPMMPVVSGVDFTLHRVLYYALALVMVSPVYALINGSRLYAAMAVILGGLLMRKVWQAFCRQDAKSIREVFTFSIIYLFGIFAAMMADKILVGSF